MNEVVANTCRQMLSNVTHISKKYEEIAKISGENFNIFNILGLSTLEVRTHSAFIAELLNPDGTHGKGEVFLRHFVDYLKFSDFNTTNAKTEVEKYIGVRESETGGRIDILVTDKINNRPLIIENKIYAGPQENQLLRYFNFGKKYKEAILLYLTLNGEDPPDETTSKKLVKNEDYRIISYKDDIKHWLELCRKDAADLPLLRESITQYINLINRLTNQSINQNMSKEIVKTILSDEDNIKAAFSIWGAIDDMKSELALELNNQLKQIFESKGLTLKYKLSNSSYSGFEITNDFLSKLNLMIRFEFEGRYYMNFYYGFVWIDPNQPNNELQIKLKTNFEGRFGPSKSTKGWPSYTGCEKEFWNWNCDAFISIKKGSMAKYIDEKVVGMLEVCSAI